MKNLEELKKKCNNSSDIVSDGDSFYRMARVSVNIPFIQPDLYQVPMSKADYVFYCSARKAVPALIEAVEALKYINNRQYTGASFVANEALYKLESKMEGV